jgi:hypothetical protein
MAGTIYIDGIAEEFSGWVYDYRGRNIHRLDGPAIEYADGTKIWYLNNQRHQLDGPAIEWTDGTKIWYLNGKLHRINGPAIEHADGSLAWYLNDVYYKKDDHPFNLFRLEYNLSNIYEDWPIDMKALFVLMYG